MHLGGGGLCRLLGRGGSNLLVENVSAPSSHCGEGLSALTLCGSTWVCRGGRQVFCQWSKSCCTEKHFLFHSAHTHSTVEKDCPAVMAQRPSWPWRPIGTYCAFPKISGFLTLMHTLKKWEKPFLSSVWHWITPSIWKGRKSGAFPFEFEFAD